MDLSECCGCSRRSAAFMLLLNFILLVLLLLLVSPLQALIWDLSPLGQSAAGAAPSSAAAPAAAAADGGNNNIASSAAAAGAAAGAAGVAGAVGGPGSYNLDPILAYSGGAEINQLQWSTAQPDWVAVSFANKTQILRV